MMALHVYSSTIYDLWYVTPQQARGGKAGIVQQAGKRIETILALFPDRPSQTNKRQTPLRLDFDLCSSTPLRPL